MNVVNEMVSDLDSRDGKSPIKKRKITIPWQTSSVVVLILGISTLSFTIWSFERESVEDPMVQVAQFDKTSAKDNIPEMETLSEDTNFIQKKTIENAITKTKPKQHPVKSELVLNKERDQKGKSSIASSKKNQTIQNTKVASTTNNLTKSGLTKKQPRKINHEIKTLKLISKEHKSTKTPVIKRPKPTPATTKIVALDKSDRIELPPVLNEKSISIKAAAPIKKNPASERKITSNQLSKKSIEFTRTQKSKRYYADALVKLNGGDTALAKSLLQKALMTKKKHIAARKLLAGIYINQKELTKAKKLLIEGIKQLPESSVFYHWLGRIYMEQGDFDQASVLLSDGSKYAKKGDYFALMALAQQNTDGFESAIESYQRALSIIPSQSKWWLGLGIVFEKIENWKEAETAYSTALLSENLPFKLHDKTTGRLTFVKNQIALLDD